MNPLKVTDRLPDEYDGALALLQLQSGQPCDNYEREFPDVVQEVALLKITTLKYGEKSDPPAMDIDQPSPEEALPTKENVENAPSQKRGRSNVSNVLQLPAKRAKMMAAKNPMIIPLRAASTHSSIEREIPRSKKNISDETIAEREVIENCKYSKEKKRRESDIFANMRLFT